MKKTVKWSFIMTLIVIISSCEKELDEIEPEITAESTTNEFSVIDGYLSFPSNEAFINTLNMIADFTDDERINWEKQNGFLSQATIIKNIIDEEIKSHEITKEKFKGVKIENINKRDLHSDIYNHYLDKGMIKLIDEGTKDEYWNYSIYNHKFLNFIDEDGFYAIADTLYQVTNEGLKANTDNNSYFIEKLDNSKDYPDCPGYIWSEWGYAQSRANRVIMALYLDADRFHYAYLNNYEYKHNLIIYCQEQQWYGGWMYSYEEIYFTGSWDIKTFYYTRHKKGKIDAHKNASQYFAGVYPTGNYLFEANKIFKIFSLCNHTFDQFHPPQFESFEWHVSVVIDMYNHPHQICNVSLIQEQQ